ncbi:MAG: glutamine amidotransferase [Pelagibacterales bacterium]|nr:glutamine amidotransferase [Pelagibacterales bacterium]
MIDVAIIDLQTSNMKSVIGACKKVNLKYSITSNPKDLKKARALILPGVGSFKNAMNFLKKKKLIKPIKEFFDSGKPILGICLGMQLFFKESSEYGLTKGINIIDSSVKKFTSKDNSKIPNIGWSTISNKKKFKNKIFNNINTNKSFYFVHSYYVNKFEKKEHNVEISNNGNIEFCAFVNFKNLYLFQFHPEKSSLEGLKIYKNFKKLIKK